MSLSNPSKFIGKKSSPCRKCGNVRHYVNPMGGASCFTCYPPRQSNHVLGVIISEGGYWTSEPEAFGPTTSPAQPDRVATTANRTAGDAAANHPCNASGVIIPDIDWPCGVLYVSWSDLSAVVYGYDDPVSFWPPRIYGRRIVTQSVVEQMARWCDVRLRRPKLLDREICALAFAGALFGFLGQGVFPGPVRVPDFLRRPFGESVDLVLKGKSR